MLCQSAPFRFKKIKLCLKTVPMSMDKQMSFFQICMAILHWNQLSSKKRMRKGKLNQFFIGTKPMAVLSMVFVVGKSHMNDLRLLQVERKEFWYHYSSFNTPQSHLWLLINFFRSIWYFHFKKVVSSHVSLCFSLYQPFIEADSTK